MLNPRTCTTYSYNVLILRGDDVANSHVCHTCVHSTIVLFVHPITTVYLTVREEAGPFLGPAHMVASDFGDHLMV